MQGPFTPLSALAQNIYDFFGHVRPQGRKTLLDRLKDQTFLDSDKRIIHGPLYNDTEDIVMCIVYPENSPQVCAALPEAEIFVVLCETRASGLPHQWGQMWRASRPVKRLPPMIPPYAPVCGTHLLEQGAMDRARGLAEVVADMLNADVEELGRPYAKKPLTRVFNVLEKQSGSVAVVCKVQRLEGKKKVASQEEGFEETRLPKDSTVENEVPI